jgi:hypothetical protein
MHGYFVGVPALPVDGYALVLEQVWKPALDRGVVVEDLALLGANERTNPSPWDNDFALARLEP